MLRPQTAFRICFLIALLLFAVTCGSSNVGGGTLQFPAETDPLVVAAVFGTAVDQPTTLYRHPTALDAGDVLSAIAVFDPANPEVEPIAGPVFTAGAGTTYFYFADYATGSQYAHPVEYILVNGATGALTRIAGEWWPMLNGAELFFTKTQVNDAANIVRRDYPGFAGGGAAPDWLDAGLEDEVTAAVSAAGRQASVETPEQHVLIINGIDPTDDVRDAAETAADNAEDALEGGGYESITKIDFKKEDPQPAPDDAARQTRDAIFKFLEDFDAPNGSNLTIYVVAHGSSSSILMGKKGSSSDFWVMRNDLRKALKKLADPPRNIRIKFISQACYSGEYMKRLTSVIKVGISAAGNHTATALDIDPEAEDDTSAGTANGADTNPDDTGPEFTSGYFEDYTLIQQILSEDEERRALLMELSDGSGIPIEELILYAAFVTALEKDAAADDDKPKRYPRSLGNEALDRDDNKPVDDSHTRRVPDWIEDLIGRETEPR